MAIGLGDFVSMIKRQSRYGSVAVTNDQATSDILVSTNKRLARIWGASDWKWKSEPLSIQMFVGVSEYLVTSVSGAKVDRIKNLIPNDQTVSPAVQADPLRERTEREFYQECDLRSGSDKGTPEKYYNRGLDPNGFWQITVWPIPGTAFKLKGSAKAILTTYVIADVVSNAAIQYFPNDVVLDSLTDGVLSDAHGIQGDPAERTRLDILFREKIKALGGEQLGVATDNTPIQSPPPDIVKNRAAWHKNRGVQAG